MKKIKVAIALLLAVVLCTAFRTGYKKYTKATDSYIRDRVVMLTGNDRLCTGIEILTPSGKKAILTAAHCKALLIDDMVVAKAENGDEYVLSFIAIDPAHDLMLLTSLDDKYITVAESIYPHEKVHSLTHGRGFSTYRTDGELLDERSLTFPIFEITSDEEMNKCPTTPYEKAVLDINRMKRFCVVKFTLQATTAMIVPGSSGGPILDENGELVGIVKASDGDFGYMVPLRSIQHFLRNR
jgi:S1-C subfamily serine protease